MSKQEVREQQTREWLEHLRSCEAAGGSLASYARQHGIAEWKLYQWRSRLVRGGQWPAAMRAAAPQSPSEVVPVRFARVAVTSPAPVYIVRLLSAAKKRSNLAGTGVFHRQTISSILKACLRRLEARRGDQNGGSTSEAFTDLGTGAGDACWRSCRMSWPV